MVPLIRDPMPMTGKAAWDVFAALEAFLERPRVLGHSGMETLNFVWDGALFTALTRHAEELIAWQNKSLAATPGQAAEAPRPLSETADIPPAPTAAAATAPAVSAAAAPELPGG